MCAWGHNFPLCAYALVNVSLIERQWYIVFIWRPELHWSCFGLAHWAPYSLRRRKTREQRESLFFIISSHFLFVCFFVSLQYIYKKKRFLFLLNSARWFPIFKIVLHYLKLHLWIMAVWKSHYKHLFIYCKSGVLNMKMLLLGKLK